MTDKDKPTTRKQKPRPPFSGFAIVADFWLWGALSLCAPTYLNVAGVWIIFFNVLGSIAIIISLTGALVELGKLWKSEALSYWGASLVFLLPAVLLHVTVTYYTLLPVLATIAKIVVLVLIAVGGALFFQGVPHLVWKTEEEQKLEQAEKDSPEEAAKRKTAKHKAALKAAVSIIVILLNLTTAILKIVSELIP